MDNSSTRIRVGLEGSTSKDRYRFSLNEQSALSMGQLSQLFPNCIGLKYRDAITGEWEIMVDKDADDNLILEHGKTWDFNMVYVPLYPIFPVQATRDSTVSTTMCTLDKDFSFGQWLYRWLTGDSKKYLKLD